MGETFERLLPALRRGIRGMRTRPWLLYGAGDIEGLRERMTGHPELSERVARRAREVLEAADLSIETEPYYILGRLNALVEEQMLRPRPEVEAHMLRLLRAMGEASTWICHVHPGMRCDHCAANTAAAFVLAMEALGPALSADDEAGLTERIYEMCLRPFLLCCADRREFWAKREHPFNWRIMTCGEAGLAALGADVPERGRAVEFALEGVADILDRVPPDGDWEEGPGYWSGTLYFGLRFALALRRATDGRVNLLEHPSLKATADYLTCVVLPDGSVFNYADNSPRMSPTTAHVLARELRSGALAWTARRMGHEGPWDVLFDDPGLASAQPPDGLAARVFRTTGIAVSRSDWSPEAMYVGLKSGPTAVGHSHLDIQSFTIWRGAPLVADPGIWPYAHAIGFFDSSAGGRRWDFDANATVAHNTVLVDGQGQSCGPECAGRFLAAQTDGPVRWFISDGAAAYPGLLRKFERWLVHLLPDVVMVYDDLDGGRPRRWQWLLHTAGALNVGRVRHVLHNAGRTFSITRLLPPADEPWRNIEEARTSFYQDSDGLKETEQTVRLHRFGPMLPSERIEFLWVMEAGEPADAQWTVEREGEDAFVVRDAGPRRRGAVRFERSAHSCRPA